MTGDIDPLRPPASIAGTTSPEQVGLVLARLTLGGGPDPGFLARTRARLMALAGHRDR